MSLDIDLLLRARALERETIDRIKDLLAAPLEYERSDTDSFRYEKNIDGNVVHSTCWRTCLALEKANPSSRSTVRKQVSTCA